VVLSLEEEFAPHLVGTLLDHFAGMETTAAALTPAGSAA
jgi:purine nucleosidase